jgi:hypothetical protein
LANANIDRGDSNFDIRHAFSAGLTYDLSSARSNRLVREISGGWSLGACAVNERPRQSM